MFIFSLKCFFWKLFAFNLPVSLNIMESEPKKRRSANFSRGEIQSLLEIVKNNDFGPILERHGNDAVTINKKRNAWLKVHQDWSALPNVSKRELDQLQQKWKAIVKETKSKDAEFQRKRKSTGGGRPPQEPDSAILQVKELLSNTFTEIPNPYDGDASNSNEKDLESEGRSKYLFGHFQMKMPNFFDFFSSDYFHSI